MEGQLVPFIIGQNGTIPTRYFGHFKSFLADFFTEHYLQSVQDNPLKDYIIEQ